LRQVPVLETAQGPIRETGAILLHLAQRHPHASLWPSDPHEGVLAMRWLGFLGGALHPAFRLVWRPLRWVGDDAAAQAALRAHAGAYLARVVGAADAQLGGRDWVLAGPSALDFYLHVFTRWWRLSGQPLPDGLARHHARVSVLPAMVRALTREADTPEQAG
jgi:glutathione S-transferase